MGVADYSAAKLIRAAVVLLLRFVPDKISGCDEIKPKALQNLLNMAIKRLTTLFKAIIEIG